MSVDTHEPGSVAADFAELLAAWRTIVAKIESEHPELDPESRYQLARRAMNATLGFDPSRGE